MVDRIAEIRARVEAATPGPWQLSQIRDGSEISWLIEDVSRWRGFTNSINLGEDYETARMIANAPTDLAFLLSRLAKYEARIAAALALANKPGAHKEHVLAALSVSPEPKEEVSRG